MIRAFRFHLLITMSVSHPVAARLLDIFAAGDMFVRMRYQGEAHVVPVALRGDVALDDLLGIETQKAAFIANIERFLSGEVVAGACCAALFSPARAEVFAGRL